MVVVAVVVAAVAVIYTFVNETENKGWGGREGKSVCGCVSVYVVC